LEVDKVNTNEQIKNLLDELDKIIGKKTIEEEALFNQIMTLIKDAESKTFDTHLILLNPIFI